MALNEEITNQDELYVMDKNARPPHEPRVHEILTGDGIVEKYSFHHQEFIKMPAAHAMRFLRDEAFHVSRDEKGLSRIRPMVEAKDEAGNAVAKEPDEVVARLDELKREALLRRALSMPGGDKLGSNVSSANLIAFILGEDVEEEAEETPAPKNKPKKGKGKAGDAEGVVDNNADTMSEEELDELFGDEEEAA